MEKCLQCSEPLRHVPGRKEKSFCNVNCRNKYFYAQRKKVIADAKALLVSLPPDYITFTKVGVLTKEGGIKPIFPKPRKKPKESPLEATGESIRFVEKAENEAYNAPRWPSSLDELRALCPPELTGLERSGWIATERQKYGI